jgi:AcrR family transcriptional regulator
MQIAGRKQVSRRPGRSAVSSADSEEHRSTGRSAARVIVTVRSTRHTRVAPGRPSLEPEGGEKVPVRPVPVPPATPTPAKTPTRPSQRRRPGAKAATLSARIVATAARWIYEGKRVDMQGLADELGVSRVTLFRRVGSREELISQALWRLTERMLEIAVARWEAERPEGELHTPGTIRHINQMVAGSKGLRRLLDDEPALTMRVLTDPRGRIQSGIAAFNEELLRRDMDEFGLVTIIEPSRSSTRTCWPHASPTSKRPADSSRPSSRASCPERAQGRMPVGPRRWLLAAWPAPPAPWPRALPRPAWRPAAATGRAAAGCSAGRR